jgi:hypothetical protein
VRGLAAVALAHPLRHPIESGARDGLGRAGFAGRQLRPLLRPPGRLGVEPLNLRAQAVNQRVDFNPRGPHPRLERFVGALPHAVFLVLQRLFARVQARL